MAHASRKKMGVGAQGKRDGTGAMTELPDGLLSENMVLSNRDKALHSEERGQDSRQIQTEQFHDHAGARRNFEEMPAGREARLRSRAYALWEEEGRPEGRHQEHWVKAERESDET